MHQRRTASAEMSNRLFVSAHLSSSPLNTMSTETGRFPVEVYHNIVSAAAADPSLSRQHPRSLDVPLARSTLPARQARRASPGTSGV